MRKVPGIADLLLAIVVGTVAAGFCIGKVLATRDNAMTSQVLEPCGGSGKQGR